MSQSAPPAELVDLGGIFARRLVERRNELGISRKTVADRAFCATTTIRNIELRVHCPSLFNAAAIAAAIGLDPIDMLTPRPTAAVTDQLDGPAPGGPA